MAKHFIIYYEQTAGTFVVTEPKPWARGNRHEFPQHDFSDNDHSPRTDDIVDLLVSRYGFENCPHNNEEVRLIHNLNPNFRFPNLS